MRAVVLQNSMSSIAGSHPLTNIIRRLLMTQTLNAAIASRVAMTKEEAALTNDPSSLRPISRRRLKGRKCCLNTAP